MLTMIPYKILQTFNHMFLWVCAKEISDEQMDGLEFEKLIPPWPVAEAKQSYSSYILLKMTFHTYPC